MLMLFLYILAHQQVFLEDCDLVCNRFFRLSLNNFVGKIGLIHIKGDGS